MLMASSSSSPPPSSSLPQNRKYHVFPSFHGPDVRSALLSHTLEKFKSKGIDSFIDNDIERSESIGPELIKAIRGSRIAVVFLSKNYASSTWCLNELVEIIKCREDLGQTVMVIFHEVDPTDVKKQTSDFGKVFEETCKGKTMDVIEGWKHALAEVAIIAGYHSKSWNNEAKMIGKIATDISNKLNFSTPSSDFDRLVGMESHMINMRPFLQLNSKEVRIIGILGPPGIGKTTLARFLFNRHSKNFPLSAFMNIRAMSEKTPNAGSHHYSLMLSLQEQFMSQLINEKDIKIPHLGIIEDRLKDQKVLVVLDDVVDSVQLEAMAKETCWFGPCSRIIITTQNEKLLEQRGINLRYKVDLPSPRKALQMFCIYAFGQNYPEYGFMGLASEVTRLAGALPLGLSVMGSYLHGMSIEYWTNALPTLMTRLDGKIESILMLSFNALKDDDQNLFLHIACIFNDEWVDIVKGCLANSSSLSNVAHGLCVLVERSLVTMDSGRIRMHNLLVLLGKEIVRKESSDDPGKRKFLCDAGDICEVLSDDQAGSSSVIGINLKEDIKCTNERAFKRLSNLRFLRIDHHGININPRSMNYISRKLRLLSWTYFRISCFPSSFHPNFLVKLDMKFSGLEKLWEDTQPLSNLKWMNLSGSYSLKELPDLSAATNLCELDLSYCSRLMCLPSIGDAENLYRLNLSKCRSLVKLHPSIGNAINLERLELSSCSSLVEIPSSIGNAINLISLRLDDCSRLVEIPSSIENAINLQYVDFSDCLSLVELPNSIGNEVNLQYLNLNGLTSLVELPYSFENAINLHTLSLGGCSSLVKLPNTIGNAVNLEILNLRGCSSLVEVPYSIGKAINLISLLLEDCSSLVELPSSIIKLRKLKCLILIKCSKLEVLLTGINLESLRGEELNLSDCSLLRSYSETSTNIDPWFGRISKLRRLILTRMKKMVTLPQLPDSVVELDAENCESLEILDCSFRNPDIKRLNFRKCFKLNKKARDLIIQTRTRGYAVLPGREMPVCFTYQSSGGSLKVNLNEKPVPTSIKFKACIILSDEDDQSRDYESDEDPLYNRSSGYVRCEITSTKNGLRACMPWEKTLDSFFSKHLYIFEGEVDRLISTFTELVFEFEVRDWDGKKVHKIRECGIYQLPGKPYKRRRKRTELFNTRAKLQALSYIF